MVIVSVIFWVSTFLVFYTFVVYPLMIAVAAKLWPNHVKTDGPIPTGFSLIMSVRNEQAFMGRRLRELIGIVEKADIPAELLIICDGSTDDSAAIARAASSAKVRVVEWSTNRGKAAALNHAASLAQHEILILADARQTWAEDSARSMLQCFRDSQVGAVSGQLLLKKTDGKLAGVSLYWKFEKWLRSKEAQFDSQIGVTGAICAVRRELFRLLPQGIILDDVCWPMDVVMQHQRVVYQPHAIAYDELPARSSDEFRRKVRTLVGNFQLLSICPRLLLPWQNRVAWQFVSHKVLRLVAPWALAVMIIASGCINSDFYRWVFGFLVVNLVIGILGMVTSLGQRYRLFSTAGSFFLLQFAAWIAFWYWIFGRADMVWSSSSAHTANSDQA